VRHVDPEPVHATVQPEPQDVLELGAYPRVGPVQVGLLDIEEVQVPLAVGYPGPSRAAERALPAVRGLRAVRAGAVAEQVTGPFRAARGGGQRLLEPRMLVGGVVGYQVDDESQPLLVCGGDQCVGVAELAEQRVHVAVVGHVVARVGLRRAEERREPQRVHAQLGQVWQPGGDAGQVTDAVTVGVGERARVDLVDHRLPPPRGGVGRRWCERQVGGVHHVGTP